MEENEILLQMLSTDVVQTASFWLLGILLAILVVMRIIGGGRLLAFNNPTGRVLVSRSAIKGLIARTCNTIEGIGHAQSRILTSGGRLRARVYIQLKSNTRLSDIASLLQERLDLALRQNLGIERIGKIDVIVTDVQPAPKPRVGHAPKGAYTGSQWDD